MSVKFTKRKDGNYSFVGSSDQAAQVAEALNLLFGTETTPKPYTSEMIGDGSQVKVSADQAEQFKAAGISVVEQELPSSQRQYTGSLSTVESVAAKTNRDPSLY